MLGPRRIFMTNPSIDQNRSVKKGLPETEVKNNEDSSLQDESYAFDESNTGNEEFHDALEVNDEDDYDVDDYLHE
jgi:hypothetical protein